MAANLVTFCCSTERHGGWRTARLLSLWEDPAPLLLFFSLYFSSKPRARSVGRMRVVVQRRPPAISAVARSATMMWWRRIGMKRMVYSFVRHSSQCA